MSASFFNSSLSSSFSFFPICFGVFPPVHKDTGGGSSFFRLRHLHGVGRLQMRLRFSPYFNRFLPVLLHAPLARQECVVYNIYAVCLAGGRQNKLFYQIQFLFQSTNLFYYKRHRILASPVLYNTFQYPAFFDPTLSI